jgi:hypothetical protein
VSSGLEEAHGKLQILARNGPMVASHGSVSLVQKERATGPQGQGCSSWIYGILQPWGSSSGTSGKWKTWPA